MTEDVVHAELGPKPAVWSLNIRGHVIAPGCGWDVHRRSVGALWSCGSPRQRAKAVLAVNRSILSRWCLFRRILFVQGLWTLKLSSEPHKFQPIDDERDKFPEISVAEFLKSTAEAN
jgi:hypothetical protein